VPDFVIALLTIAGWGFCSSFTYGLLSDRMPDGERVIAGLLFPVTGIIFVGVWAGRATRRRGVASKRALRKEIAEARVVRRRKD
jgi:hypothetical protein